MSGKLGGAERSRLLSAAVYTLGRTPEEADRLRRQSAELWPLSAALLDRVGVGPGQSAIDLGCGPSGIIELLCERVGPGGRVAGVDLDPALLSRARAFAREKGLANVEIMKGDARRTGLPSSSFDLVHARTLLVNLPDPGAVVAEMVRLAKPGGWVAGMEPDLPGMLCHPPHPAWDRLVEISAAAYRADGAELRIGRRVPGLFRLAGLTDVAAEAHAELYPPGHSRRTVRLELVRSMRAKIVERGIASERELDELDRVLRVHLDDPATLVIPHLFILAWGRKPDGVTA
jgi:SAM-dependent methyltransferase